MKIIEDVEKGKLCKLTGRSREISNYTRGKFGDGGSKPPVTYILMILFRSHKTDRVFPWIPPEDRRDFGELFVFFS